MVSPRLISILFGLQFIFASSQPCKDNDTVVEVFTDKYDKYFYRSHNAETACLDSREWSLIGSSMTSNIATMLLLGISFWAIHECGLNTQLQDCYHRDLAVDYGLLSMFIWILGCLSEMALSSYRIPALIRVPFAALAYMIGYAEKVSTGMAFAGSLAILSAFSMYFTIMNVLYNKFQLAPKKND